jgi:hypothetical protein
MDSTTRSQIARQIQEAKARLPELEKDIADARKAGLGDVVRVQEQVLQRLKTFLQQLETVYGGKG